MKKTFALFAVTLSAFYSLNTFADCSDVKPELRTIAKLIAADEPLGYEIFDLQGVSIDFAQLKGEAREAADQLRDTEEEWRIGARVSSGMANVDVDVIGESAEGNGYFSVYTTEGDFLNRIPFTESSNGEWECSAE